VLVVIACRLLESANEVHIHSSYIHVGKQLKVV
jgi:hypothetical protein